MHSDNVHNIYLIDTPGFDDTDRSDVEILTQIANYLSVSYANSIYISGIILLHRISDNRFSGSSRRNITMFKELVGEMAYENVAIATTMWWNGEHEMNLKKEKELQDEHFSDILSSGGTLFRLTGGLEAVDSAGAREQAMDIIAHLMLKAKEGPVVLRIQNEMVDETLALNRTAAGKVVETAVEVSRKEFEAQLQEARKEIADALRNQDSAAARVAREIHRELDEKDQKIVREQEALQKSLIEMYAKEEARVKKRIDQMELQWKEAAQKKEQELREVEARLAELQRTTEAEAEATRREEEQRVQQIQQQLNQERHTHHPQRRQEETEEMTSWSAIDAKWKARMAEQALQADQYRRRETQRLAKAEDARGRQEKEVLRLKKEMVALRQSIATKEEATSKVKEGFKKSTLSGIISGLASGTATAGK